MAQEVTWIYTGPGGGQKIVPRNIQEFHRLYTGNTGNLLYYFATQCAIQFKAGPHGAETIAKRFNRPGFGVVLSMANHLGKHTDLSVNGWPLSGLDIPVIALGLGAQVKNMTNDLSFIPEGTISWLRELAARAPSNGPNITVRGEYTLEIMRELGFGDRVVSIGCQTNFINPQRDLGRLIGRVIREKPLEKITVAAGNPFEQDHRKLEASLLALAMETSGDYVVQHPLSMVQLVANYSDEEFDDAWTKVYPAYRDYGFNEPDFRRAVRNTFKVYSDISQWMRSHRQSDLVVGTRIHGVQSALQAGVPAICLFIDSRTEELCRRMKIPHASAREYKNGIKKEQLNRILMDWDYEEYDRNRLELAKKFGDFLTRNGVGMSPAMKQLAGL
ncbi:polysaccharide pyruvyl transferase family protein [Bordetella sp. 2513F-2]